jgi:signal transduction histidine kinase/ActR/RegA family two-component response regulator
MVLSAFADEKGFSARALSLLGGLSLLTFEGIYYWLGAPTGPLWLRLAVVFSCLGLFLLLQFKPRLRRHGNLGAAVLAVLVTAENIYRMYLVDFMVIHSIPMLIVMAGASYAFRSQLGMTLYLVSSSIGLTVAILLTEKPEISPYIYVPTVWVLSILTFIVFGSRVQDHNQAVAQGRILNGIFEGSYGGLILVEDNRIVMSNDRASDILGNSDPARMMHRLSSTLSDFQRLDESGSCKSDFEHDIYRNEITFMLNKRQMWIDVFVRRVDVSGGDMLLISLYDVTDRRQALSDLEQSEQMLIEARDTAEEALEVRGTFLANMSHEIRTPMNGVIGMTSLLLRSDLSASQRDFVQTIQASGESLLHLINDILDFSKIAARKMELDDAPFYPRDLLVGTLETLQVTAKEKGIVLTMQVDDGIPASLIGDIARLRQTLINLVNNAVKFTEQGQVDVRLEGKWLNRFTFELKMAISDTGIGIPQDKVDMLFEAFIQQDASTTRKFGGTGLGLSISKGLITLMGGRISVTSEVKKGTCFEVSVPLVSDHHLVEEPTSLPVLELNAAPEETLATHMQVLLAEDNLVNQKVAAAMLVRLGYRVDVVETGLQAIDAVCAGDYDVVLMDIQMPELDGLEATKRIRSMPKLKQPIVIALTANAMQADRESCLSAGMNDFLPKPITLESLSSTMASISSMNI